MIGVCVMEQRPTLSAKEAATYLGVSEQYLALSRCRTTRDRVIGPPYIKIGRSVRYLRSDLDRFLELHRVDPGADVEEVAS